MQTASQATPFDTLAAAKHLQAAGVAEKQAEAIVHVMSQSQGNLATKADIQAVKTDLIQLKYDMTIRFGVMLAATVGVIKALDKLL